MQIQYIRWSFNKLSCTPSKFRMHDELCQDFFKNLVIPFLKKRFLKILSSFRCQDGYQVADNRKSIRINRRIAFGVLLKFKYLGCEDIDECASGNKCHKHGICTNFAVCYINRIFIRTSRERSEVLIFWFPREHIHVIANMDIPAMVRKED